MPDISVILSCYNTGRFLEQSILSVVGQQFTRWELIIVNDGSTDNSLEIAERYARADNRISVRSKPNGGLASARLHGLKFISPGSPYILFYDADDMMHPEMLLKLFNGIEADPSVGAIYCNHRLIDAENGDLGLPRYGKRIVPTHFGVRSLDEDLSVTPFISIFCWMTRMIEPMTLIRRVAYEHSRGWDPGLGGRGNIGEGVLLFSEIALSWKVLYIHEPLYLYRKHPQQATTSNNGNKGADEKLLRIWEERIREDRGYLPFSRDIRAAILCYRTRIQPYYQLGSLKHQLKHMPVRGMALICSLLYRYMLSLRLLFYADTRVFKY